MYFYQPITKANYLLQSHLIEAIIPELLPKLPSQEIWKAIKDMWVLCWLQLRRPFTAPTFYGWISKSKMEKLWIACI